LGWATVEKPAQVLFQIIFGHKGISLLSIISAEIKFLNGDLICGCQNRANIGRDLIKLLHNKEGTRTMIGWDFFAS
jgi:hypothetical protein